MWHWVSGDVCAILYHLCFQVVITFYYKQSFMLLGLFWTFVYGILLVCGSSNCFTLKMCSCDCDSPVCGGLSSFTLSSVSVSSCMTVMCVQVFRVWWTAASGVLQATGAVMCPALLSETLAWRRICRRSGEAGYERGVCGAVYPCVTKPAHSSSRVAPPGPCCWHNACKCVPVRRNKF